MINGRCVKIHISNLIVFEIFFKIFFLFLQRINALNIWIRGWSLLIGQNHRVCNTRDESVWFICLEWHLLQVQSLCRHFQCRKTQSYPICVPKPVGMNSCHLRVFEKLKQRRRPPKGPDIWLALVSCPVLQRRFLGRSVNCFVKNLDSVVGVTKTGRKECETWMRRLKQ